MTNVLLIEDDQAIIDAVTNALNKWNYQVSTITN